MSYVEVQDRYIYMNLLLLYLTCIHTYILLRQVSSRCCHLFIGITPYQSEIQIESSSRFREFWGIITPLENDTYTVLVFRMGHFNVGRLFNAVSRKYQIVDTSEYSELQN